MVSLQVQRKIETIEILISLTEKVSGILKRVVSVDCSTSNEGTSIVSDRNPTSSTTIIVIISDTTIPTSYDAATVNFKVISSAVDYPTGIVDAIPVT